MGKSQRHVLRLGPTNRKVPFRDSVREGELGKRLRRERPADPNATRAQHTRLSGQPGRYELVLAVVQPEDRTVLCDGVAKLLFDVQARDCRVRTRTPLRRWWQSNRYDVT